ncbi:MAG: hypothetical protein NWE93_10840 [Candidatus Bathyarchaeota archaeon]|nr:hypothetical protein [Candidatus Bathyarchaeota archaeon]
MSFATPIVDFLPPPNPFIPLLFILWFLFPILSLSAVLLLRNNKSVSAHTVGAMGLFLGGLGLAINIGVIAFIDALAMSGFNDLIVTLDLLMIIGLQMPNLYVGYSKFTQKSVAQK